METTNTKTETGNQENFQPKGNRLQPDMRDQNQPENDSLKQTATNTLNQIKEKTSDTLTEQKTNLTSGLKEVAQGVREVSDNLRKSEETTTFAKVTARYGRDFAQQIDRFSGYLENANFRDLAHDVEGFARRQPALFLGGAFTLGLLLARFLKTSRPTQFISEAVKDVSQSNPNQNLNISAQPL